MRFDIMTDIETLGTNSDSTIFQISAIAFDIKTGEHLSQFNKIANISKNKSLQVTGDTIKWWLNTDKELFTKLLNGGEESSEQVLTNFYNWLVDMEVNCSNDIYLWGNGILFDNKMIQCQVEQLGLKYPIFYKNDRDLRTLVELASIKLGVTEKELKEKFNDDALKKHDAFDDVKYQINLAVSCFNELMRK